MVTGLLCIDLVILLTWQIYDPLQRRLETFPLENPVSDIDDMKLRPEVEHCESVNNSIWLGEWGRVEPELRAEIVTVVVPLQASCTDSRD